MNYYSEYGEDRFLAEHCSLPEQGVFVDVGAGGTENSNSLFFEQKGWKVLCIEPDTRHIGLSERKLVDNSIVGSEEKEVDFVFHHYPVLSGLFHKRVQGTKMKMVKLDTLLEKYGIEAIDIMSIDVEGNETDVLLGFSIQKYRPKYFIIEYKNQFKGDCEWETRRFFEVAGYKMVLTTPSNLIMERK